VNTLSCIDLIKEDVDFLVNLLEKEYTTALAQERHAHHYEYREVIKAKEREIEDLLEKLKQHA
jgi:hypothetical protein